MAIVGNGPSAEGKADEIDGYEFVVRLRDWWRCAAEHAGDKISAHAYFCWWDNWQADPHKGFEHWFTWCPEQLEHAGSLGWQRLAFFNRRAGGGRVRWLTNARWNQLRGALGDHPSTGIVAVTMAIDRFRSVPIELGLYGFDSTTPERPNFFDAREANKVQNEQYQVTHNILAEKRLLADLQGRGEWINGKRDIKVTWPDKPELPSK